MPALAIVLLLLLPIVAAVFLVYIKHATRLASKRSQEKDLNECTRYRDRSLYYYLQSSRNGDLLRDEELIKTDFGTERSTDRDHMPGSG